jgi:hypothetical protein
MFSFFHGWWRVLPNGWYGIMRFEFVVEIVPTIGRVVVYKDTGVPAAVELAWATMKAFG